MNSKIPKLLAKVLFLLLYSLILLGLGILVALLISHFSGGSLQEVMSYEGILLVIIGILLSLKGNPSGLNLSGVGQNNNNAILYQELEYTRLEKEITEYNKNIWKNNIVEFGLSNLTFLLGGVMIILFSFIMK